LKNTQVNIQTNEDKCLASTLQTRSQGLTGSIKICKNTVHIFFK